jgi:hypothetical protein
VEFYCINIADKYFLFSVLVLMDVVGLISDSNFNVTSCRVSQFDKRNERISCVIGVNYFVVINERIRRELIISEINVDSKFKWTQDLLRKNDIGTPT